MPTVQFRLDHPAPAHRHVAVLALDALGGVGPLPPLVVGGHDRGSVVGHEVVAAAAELRRGVQLGVGDLMGGRGRGLDHAPLHQAELDAVRLSRVVEVDGGDGVAEVAAHPLPGHSLGQLVVAVDQGHRGVAAEAELPRFVPGLAHRLHERGVEDRIGEREGVQAPLPGVVDVLVTLSALAGARVPFGAHLRSGGGLGARLGVGRGRDQHREQYQEGPDNLLPCLHGGLLPDCGRRRFPSPGLRQAKIPFSLPAFPTRPMC